MDVHGILFRFRGRMRRHPRAVSRLVLMGLAPLAAGLVVTVGLRPVIESRRGGGEFSAAQTALFAAQLTSYLCVLWVPVAASAFLGLHGSLKRVWLRVMGWTALAGCMFLVPVAVLGYRWESLAVLMVTLAAASLSVGTVQLLRRPVAGQIGLALLMLIVGGIACFFGAWAWGVACAVGAVGILLCVALRGAPWSERVDSDLGARMGGTLIVTMLFLLPFGARPVGTFGTTSESFVETFRFSASWSSFLATADAWTSLRKTIRHPVEQPAPGADPEEIAASKAYDREVDLARHDARLGVLSYSLFAAHDFNITWSWHEILVRITLAATIVHFLAFILDGLFRDPEERRHRAERPPPGLSPEVR